MTDNELGKLMGRMDGQDKLLERIDKALYGNGNPGAMDRLTRIEKNLEQSTELQAEIQAVIKKHEAKPHVFNLATNKQAIAIIFLIYTGAEIVVANFPQLWALIIKVFAGI